MRESKEQREDVIDGKIYMKYWIGAGVSYFLNKKIQLTRESRRFFEIYFNILRDEKYYFNAIEYKILNIDLTYTNLNIAIKTFWFWSHADILV